MALRVYDTLKQKKTDFEPVHPGKVGMYVCGITVQDKPYMGHMLAFVSGDMIRRYLEYLGYEVAYIQNFTDIDDKIIDRASKEGVDYRVVVERNIEAYHRIARAVNIKPATIYPYATQHMAEIIAIAEKFAAVMPMLKDALQFDAPDAAFYLWARVPGGDDAAFARGLYEKQHVTVLPGSFLARDAAGVNPGKGFVRIALVDSLDACVEAAHRIVRFVEARR